MSPQVEAAIKAIAKIGANPAKFEAFCRLNKEMAGLGDEETATAESLDKLEALDQQMADLMKSIGADVAAAWDLAGELDPESEDGKALSVAIEDLEERCGD